MTMSILIIGEFESLTNEIKKAIRAAIENEGCYTIYIGITKIYRMSFRKRKKMIIKWINETNFRSKDEYCSAIFKVKFIKLPDIDSIKVISCEG